MKTSKLYTSILTPFLVLSQGFALPAHAFGQRRPASVPVETHYLITLGDSISAGFIGYTQVDPVPPPGLALKSTEPAPPNSLLGIRYAAALESKSEWSWATGNKTNSVATRLEGWLKSQPGGENRALSWYNQAESGAVAKHLPRQARLAAEALRGVDPNRVALVTLLIGANDVCGGNGSADEAQKMKTDIVSALGNISAMGAARTRVYLSSIPNIPDLSQPEILNRPAEFGLTCKGVRQKVVNFCPSLLNWSSAAEYQANSARIRSTNDTLRAAADEAKIRYGNLDVVFDLSFYETVIPSEFLAYDCFHPGRDGHRYLADLFWKAMTWFR